MFFPENLWFFVFKLRVSAWNRLQIVPGYVRDVCDAPARVSGLAELRKPPKFTEIGEPESKSLTVP